MSIRALFIADPETYPEIFESVSSANSLGITLEAFGSWCSSVNYFSHLGWRSGGAFPVTRENRSWKCLRNIQYNQVTLDSFNLYDVIPAKALDMSAYSAKIITERQKLEDYILYFDGDLEPIPRESNGVFRALEALDMVEDVTPFSYTIKDLPASWHGVDESVDHLLNIPPYAIIRKGVWESYDTKGLDAHTREWYDHYQEVLRDVVENEPESYLVAVTFR